MVLRTKKPSLVAGAAIAVLCLLALTPQAADATFPGRPGLIVFNLLTFPGNPGEPIGGLYALRPGQEQPRQLTDDPGDNSPSFSPSGNKLVFRRTDAGLTNASGIYTLDLSSGRTTRIPSRRSDQDPTFGPHGMIAFSRFSPQTGSYDLFLRLQTGHLRRLTSTTAKEQAPVFTPDGRRIVFSRRYGQAAALSRLERRETRPPALYSIRLDGTGLHLLGSPRGEDFDISPDGHHLAFAGVGGISYSPDGRKIVYANHEGLWLRRANGQGKSTLILAADYNSNEKRRLLIQPAWQPLP
jgi:Tol biopolymer transport system component